MISVIFFENFDSTKGVKPKSKIRTIKKKIAVDSARQFPKNQFYGLHIAKPTAWKSSVGKKDFFIRFSHTPLAGTPEFFWQTSLLKTRSLWRQNQGLSFESFEIFGTFDGVSFIVTFDEVADHSTEPNGRRRWVIVKDNHKVPFIWLVWNASLVAFHKTICRPNFGLRKDVKRKMILWRLLSFSINQLRNLCHK